MYVVIDTWVWQKAQEVDSTCLSLLSTLFDKCKHKILCDIDGEIEKEYFRYLKRDLLLNLFTEMIKKGKIEKKNRCQIKNDFGFDPNDLKFLEMAILVNAVIISGDKHFQNLRRNLQSDPVLKGKLRNVRIITPSEANNSLL